MVSWVDATSKETVLFPTPLANRPPVLRNWGMAARYPVCRHRWYGRRLWITGIIR